jgi:hypothetical protein
MEIWDADLVGEARVGNEISWETWTTGKQMEGKRTSHGRLERYSCRDLRLSAPCLAGIFVF